MSFGRLPIRDIKPTLAGGFPGKAALGESAPITATVFREGHNALGVDVVLTRPDNSQLTQPMELINWGRDIWQAWVVFDQLGDWIFQITAYDDRWGTWCHQATIKLEAEIDTDLVAIEGQSLISEALVIAKDNQDQPAIDNLQKAKQTCQAANPADLEKLTTADNLKTIITQYLPRRLTTLSEKQAIRVDRQRAQFGSWYEFFPRSPGAHVDENGQWVSGSFDDCHQLLERVAELGFDVIYLPPIHPIGRTFRKGPNNSLTASPQDPGSPWAIGSAEGGHDVVHPDLGGLPAFQRFVSKAKSLGLEIALDFALQTSPDHPWLNQHPEWFTTRPDGSIAYAENPPKKYQDIYPINCDNDRQGLQAECLRLLEFWIEQGVTIFRVDNPHTKPVDFWVWLLASVRQTHPEVIFLAEAFTRPPMLQTLATIGFHQSYTYFTWRTSRQELEKYLDEVAHQTDWAMRPNFFVNTPDINPLQVRSGQAPAFAIRMILAATMSPSWGVYSGFELLEHQPLKEGGEEYLNSEKYQYCPRDFSAEPNLDQLMSQLNHLRRHHPALQQLRTVAIQSSSDDQVLAFTKVAGQDRVLVIISLDHEQSRTSQIKVDPATVDLSADGNWLLQDVLSGDSFTWGGGQGEVTLTPDQPALILTIGRPNR